MIKNAVFPTPITSPDDEFLYEDDGTLAPDDYPISEYEIISSPNDFNIKTIIDYIDHGTIIIPNFQRNYVWDIKRASKLIESIIVNLPIPQIFLYEIEKNKLLVIDGQQRLMTIYYFVNQRFPKLSKRLELRDIFTRDGLISQDILNDDAYFDDFKLTLPGNLPNLKSKFHSMTYETLEDRFSFDLRTIRCIIIKQTAPDSDDSAAHEIFNRFNSGGLSLQAQEFRMSLYYSDFYAMLNTLNLDPGWRRLLGNTEPDLHLKDIEILLRAFAMLISGDEYRPSMTRFLNHFSKQAQSYKAEDVKYFEELFLSFIASCSGLDAEDLQGSGRRFGIALFEALFTAVCASAFQYKILVTGKVDPDSLRQLTQDPDFSRAANQSTATKENVRIRLSRAKNLIKVTP